MKIATKYLYQIKPGSKAERFLPAWYTKHKPKDRFLRFDSEVIDRSAITSMQKAYFLLWYSADGGKTVQGGGVALVFDMAELTKTKYKANKVAYKPENPFGRESIKYFLKK